MPTITITVIINIICQCSILDMIKDSIALHVVETDGKLISYKWYPTRIRRFWHVCYKATCGASVVIGVLVSYL